MDTIAEPVDYIARLWGEPKVYESDHLRLMRYVMRISHEKNELLLNVVTGQLVLLNEEEATALGNFPVKLEPVVKPLVDAHFLVVHGFDEHRQVVKMREVLRLLHSSRNDSSITTYTILPTTACNARCYYCFEKGTKYETMTEDTAHDVVKYIADHCGDNKSVFISWFGGEPTIATNRIDQICAGLQKRAISYTSEITTNGYLFDEHLVKRAKELWKLQNAMISVDGIENNYNRIKSYVNVKDNPYQRVIRNVGLLVSNGIHVNLRMNFDLNNYKDFELLVASLSDKYSNNPFLHVRAHPVNGEYPDDRGVLQHGDDNWFEKRIVELNTIAKAAGLQRSTRSLPFLRFEGCEASSDSAVTITVDGNLVRCPEQFGDDQVTGDIYRGITRPDRVKYWKQVADYEKCKECILYPRCNRLMACSAKDRCQYYPENILIYEETAKQLLNSWKRKSNI